MKEFRFCAEKRPKLAEFRKALWSNREDRPMVDGAEGGTGSGDTREQASLVRNNERVEARDGGAGMQAVKLGRLGRNVTGDTGQRCYQRRADYAGRGRSSARADAAISVATGLGDARDSAIAALNAAASVIGLKRAAFEAHETRLPAASAARRDSTTPHCSDRKIVARTGLVGCVRADAAAA